MLLPLLVLLAGDDIMLRVDDRIRQLLLLLHQAGLLMDTSGTDALAVSMYMNAYDTACRAWSNCRLLMCMCMCRLNFSVVLLMMTHGNTYILYYICPLHTFYFMMVYVTMSIYQVSQSIYLSVCP
jgi:hypothetical protein